ncbi:hypothetical protein DL769_011281 [Monosporascus sp. CRB-8-3]|nr:hypothetical protein DL769_011281 [Monosporascus sp. CRB-8-3]
MRGSTTSVVGSLVAPASRYVLEFDDESLDFQTVSNNSAHSSHAWVAFGRATTTPDGQRRPDERLRARRLAAAIRRVQRVEAGSRTCGAAFPASAREGGPRYTWDYEASGIHGLALGDNGTTLYSADLKGSSVWTHRLLGAAAIDGGGGGGIEEMGRFRARDRSGPRHLVAHPAGGYLHVIMETAKVPVRYELDGDTREPPGEASVFSVIPEAQSPKPTAKPRIHALTQIQTGPRTGHSRSPSRRAGGAYGPRPRSTRPPDVGYLSMFELDTDGAVV